MTWDVNNGLHQIPRCCIGSRCIEWPDVASRATFKSINEDKSIIGPFAG